MPVVNITTNPSNIGSANGSGTYNEGDEVTIEAISEPGWVFDRWTGNTALLSASLAAITNFTLTGANMAFTANFIQDTSIGYNLHFQKHVVNIENDTIEELIEARAGDLLIDGDVVSLLGYNENDTPYDLLFSTSVPIDVDLNQGYEFIEWERERGEYEPDDYLFDSDSTSPENSFNMPAPADGTLTLTANIKAVGPFTLTTHKDPNSGGKVYQNGDVPSGGIGEYSSDDDNPPIVHLSLDPWYGYEFAEWSGDTEFIVDGSISDDEIDVVVAADIDITAVFSHLVGTVFVREQSVGPYTSGNIDSETYAVFEPKQGRDLTVLNPKFWTGVFSSSISSSVSGGWGRVNACTMPSNSLHITQNGSVLYNAGTSSIASFAFYVDGTEPINITGASGGAAGEANFLIEYSASLLYVQNQAGSSDAPAGALGSFGGCGTLIELEFDGDVVLDSPAIDCTEYTGYQRCNFLSDDIDHAGYAQTIPFSYFEPPEGETVFQTVFEEIGVQLNSAAIVEERDGRFPLGTYTLNDRDFWENITFDRITRDSQFNPKKFEWGELGTALGRPINTPDGPTVLPRQLPYCSVETLPFVKDPLTEVVVPVNEYYDKKLEKDNHELATEGKVFLKFGLRHSGRTPEGNIKIFLGRSIHNLAFKDYIENDRGFYLTSLDWGDNSKKEFTSEPKLLEEEVTLEHVYNNPGFYTIRGVVFIYRGNRVYHWEKFESNILLNPSKNYDSGIYSYDSSNNFATIGGMSLNSSFAKTLYNLAGYDPITKESKESAVIDDLNEIDQIYLLDMLSKFDSQNISNNYKRIIEAYSSVIYDKNQNILHNGFIDKRFFDSFANASLSDTDMALTKMYTGVKSMWQQLGFENDDSANPNNDVYWKNIVPKDYTFEDINGISVQDIPDPMEGSKVPRTSYKEIIIDESVEQNWDGGYRWPLLPSIDKFGAFANDTGSHGHLVNQPNKKFFGSKKSWDSDDDAPITNVNEKSENLILNIDFDQKVTDDLIDAVGAFDIQYNIDYEVKLDDDLRIKKSSEDFPDIIEKSRMEQAF